jgi:HPt (histidine-containing phosphotransfer) domain-containing protein
MSSLLGGSKPMYLDINAALSQVGDAETLHGMLVMLEETLTKDVPLIATHLRGGNAVEANRLLHPLKGFLPIFCIAQLCDEVGKVEVLSKKGSASEVFEAYSVLKPELELLLEEVADYLSGHEGG